MSTTITVKRKPRIIGVMGGKTATAALLKEATALGAGIARRGHVLLTGGGPGIMRAASAGAWRAGGLVMAVLPNDRRRKMRGYPNPFVDIPIYTDLGDGRNVINVKTPHAVVVFPGGAGTWSELALALKAGTPVITFRRPVPEDINSHKGRFMGCETVEEVLDTLDALFPETNARSRGGTS
ncbi:MAG: LOG family protein [Syntrophales bacterium]|nr:LOG family protein [Syntrophales bacterium]